MTWPSKDPAGFMHVFIGPHNEGIRLARITTAKKNGLYEDRYAGCTVWLDLPRSVNLLLALAAALTREATSVEMDNLTRGKEDG
jgi:hypothetical protein